MWLDEINIVIDAVVIIIAAVAVVIVRLLREDVRIRKTRIQRVFR